MAKSKQQSQQPATTSAVQAVIAAKRAAKVVMGEPLTAEAAYKLWQAGCPRAWLTPRVAGVLYLRATFARLAGSPAEYKAAEKRHLTARSEYVQRANAEQAKVAAK